MKKSRYHYLILFIFLLSCQGKNKSVTAEEINSLSLKKGEVVLCGPPDKQFGTVNFEFSCSEKVAQDFNLGMAMLHSFEYDEAEKIFAKIVDKQPGCAMAYWGIAMSNYHPLWTPPTPAELEKGAKAISIAKSIEQKSERESAYVDAMAMFYNDRDKLDNSTRTINFKNGMERLYKKYPADKEAAIFYALSLDAAANPSDKTFTNQKQAGEILNAIYAAEPNHPGIVHYIIHSYDYPGLAELALPAARKYASIAPSSAHAQHMPSHIFTRLGLWNECIQSNLVSTGSAKCYAENAGIKGHWDEELHGMDYLMYAYLQKGDNKRAKEQLDYLKTITEVSPVNFKVAYAFAAIPSRYFVENRMWKEAADLVITQTSFPWQKFRWQEGMIHFTKLLGDVHIGRLDSARTQLNSLKLIREGLIKEKDVYKANQVDIQAKAGEAWILFQQGNKEEALAMMRTAADMEDATEKHPVTPCEIIPARELLGDMLILSARYAEALDVYKQNLSTHPNRFNGLYGAGVAAEKSGKLSDAKLYYQDLLTISESASPRTELGHAKSFLK